MVALVLSEFVIPTALMFGTILYVGWSGSKKKED